MQMTLLPEKSQFPRTKAQSVATTGAAGTANSVLENAWRVFPPADLHADLTQSLSIAEIWATFREWVEWHQISLAFHAEHQQYLVPPTTRAATAVDSASPSLVSNRPLIVTSRAGSVQLAWLSKLEASVLSDLGAAIEILSANRAPWSAVVIDLDGFGSIGELFDDVRTLRNAADVPVILASNHFSDDFSTQRLAFCDVTLRAPASQTILRLAFSQAESNFATWKTLRAEARLRAIPCMRSARASGNESVTKT